MQILNKRRELDDLETGKISSRFIVAKQKYYKYDNNNSRVLANKLRKAKEKKNVLVQLKK